MRENNNIETPEATKVYVWAARYCPDNGEKAVTPEVLIGEIFLAE